MGKKKDAALAEARESGLKAKYDSDAVLGRMYRDNITGTSGVAIIVSFHLHACEQVTLEYAGEHGKSNFHTVDVARLIDVEAEKQLAALDAEKANGSTARPVASAHRDVS